MSETKIRVTKASDELGTPGYPVPIDRKMPAPVREPTPPRAIPRTPAEIADDLRRNPVRPTTDRH